MKLLIAKAELAHLRQVAEQGYPRETCGLLIGQTSDHSVAVAKSVQSRNLNTERARDRYLLDPHAMLRADREAQQAGLEIVGVWHTHPDHPAIPSETDRAGAWEGWSYVILSVTSAGVEAVRSWRLSGETFIEETIEPCQT